MPDTQSCLVNRLGFFLDLTPRERDTLAWMEREERHIPRRGVVAAQGDSADEVLVLKSGWAVVKGAEIRGRVPILRIYLPGEVIGMAEIGRPEVVHGVHMQTDGIVCPLPRTAVPKLMDEAPRVACLLMALGSLDQIMMREQLAALALMSAEDRMIQFLVTLLDRISVAGAGTNARFRLPFSQAEIGNILGLTPVYVNRLLSRLRDAGLIETDDRHVRILAREEMEARVNYQGLASRLDTSWFPSVNHD